MTQLHYRRASDGWLDGAPLANGYLAAVVQSHDDGVRLDLNETTLWSGSPAAAGIYEQASAQDAARALRAAREHVVADPLRAEEQLEAIQGRHAQAFLPLAHVQIKHAGAAIPRVHRTLDMAAADHTAVLGRGEVPTGDNITHHTFISRADDVLVHTIDLPQRQDVLLSAGSQLHELDTQLHTQEMSLILRAPADVAPARESDQPVSWSAPGVDPVRAALALRWRHDGEAIVEREGVRFVGVSRLEVLASARTSFAAMGREPREISDDALAAEARDLITGALEFSASELAVRHRDAHTALWETGRIDLSEAGAVVVHDPDARAREVEHAVDDPDLLTALIDFGRYLLIGSSRPGGMPANLQGVWNAQMQPPWQSGYTININTQMNYWAAGPLGLDSVIEPLFDLVEALAVAGEQTAARLYDCGGWVVHHNTDPWGYSAPTSGRPQWAIWPLGGVWLVTTLARHVAHSSDADAGRERLWPLARGAAEFVLGLLSEDEDGSLVTFPSTSPENTFHAPGGEAALTLGSGMDRALLTELFDVVAAYAQELGAPDDPVAAQVRAARDRIRPPQINPDGTITEWHPGAQAVDPQHRHLSHLVFAYPGYGPLSHELEQAVSATLDQREDESTGWSLAWKLALRARLGQPEAFARLLDLVVRPVPPGRSQAGGLYPNMFAAHPPYQIDGNFGYTAAWCEAVAHSVGTEIRLLPGVPAQLTRGRAQHLRTTSGLEIDLTWESGAPRTITLRAIRRQGAGEHTLAHLEHRVPVDVPVQGEVTLTWPHQP